MLDNYERQFGSLPPKKFSSPLEKDDHPELDDSEFLDEAGIKLYQSMIGALQWCITLGSFDVMFGVMTMSRFRIEPRIGHMDRLKRFYSYLRKHPDGRIRFHTGIPNNEDHFDMPVHDWMHTVYGDKPEEFKKGLPPPKGKKVRITAFEDSSLATCKVTGKSTTGIIVMINQTPVDWYSKLQKPVETATYGAEFMAARTCTDMIVDTQVILQSMGVPLDGSAWMMGDNQSVITSSTIPHSMLGKRHNALSYHRVRSVVAHGILKFCFVETSQNVSDFLTKGLGHKKFWPFVRPLLFWGGDTAGAGKD